MDQAELDSIVKKKVEADYTYYTLSRPIMKDPEYDALRELIRSVEPDHPTLYKVGHEPSPLWRSAKHNIHMGSLDKCNTEEEYRKWSSKYERGTDEDFIIEHKLDGLSASLDYAEVFTRGATRGDGIEGEDISPNIRRMHNFIEKIPFTGSIRAEILLSKRDFERINIVLPEDEKYENPRNAAAGIARRLDGRFCQYLYLVAYNIEAPALPVTECAKLMLLLEWGFKVPPFAVGRTDIMVRTYNEIKEKRKTLTTDIDGTVIKVNDLAIQLKAGMSQNRPRAQIAWKFDPPGAATVFLEEEWDVGRTGIVSPVALLEAVKIEGSTIRRATLHNVAEIKRLGIGRGDVVMLVKRGDIIPKVTAVIEHKGNPLIIPTKCPSCFSELENDGTRLFCHNDNCPGRNFHRILNWIRVTDIEQFGEALARALQARERLNRISDIYRLTKEQVSQMGGWGESSAETIIENINGTRTLKPEVFLAGIGIPGISDRTSEELLKAFDTVEKLMSATEEDVAALKGFSTISAATVVSGLKKYGPEIIELLGVIKLGKQEQGGLLAGLSFCFTGAMEKPRAYYQKLVADNGGRNMSAVTKDLTHLVCDEDKGSSKSQKAMKLGTKVITSQEFIVMIGGEVTETKKEPSLELPSLFDEG